MKALLVRPKPIPYESTLGYLLRVSAANGFTSLNELDRFAASAGADASGLRLMRSALRDDSVDRVVRGPITHFPHLKDSDPGGLSIQHWNGLLPRYCPACLAESAHWRASWDLSLMVACPMHHISLLQDCSACGRLLSWRRKSIHMCQCGQELALAPSVPAGDGCIALAGHIATALTGDLHIRGASLPQIDQLTLGELLSLLVLLGGYAHNRRAKPTKIAKLHDVSVATGIVQAASKVLLEWPLGYHDFLSSAGSSAAPSPSTNRLTRRFGYFYTALYKKYNTRCFDFLRTEFESFLRVAWSGQLAKRNRRLSGAMREQHTWVPLTVAAKTLAVKRGAVIEFIERGMLVGQLNRSLGGRTSGTVSRDSLMAFCGEKAGWLTLTDVRRDLRISRRRAHRLIEAGTLRPLSGPTVDGKPVWRFAATDIEALAYLQPDEAKD